MTRIDSYRPITVLLCVLAMALPFIVLGRAHGQLRVVNYNVAHLLGDPDALMDVFASLHEDDRPGFAVPVSLFIFQEVRSNDFPVLQQLLNASAPPGVLYAPGTFTNASGEDDSAGSQAMFYRAGMLLENPSEHTDIATGAGRMADRWHLRVLGYDSPLAGFYIYSAHLKSDTGAANQNLRLWGVQQIRDDAHTLGPDRNIIYAGDFNFYHNAEPGYLEWLSGALHNRAFDPLGIGSWAGPGNAIKHTQSPRTITANGLASGGMDDRFDFQLSTAPLQDGSGLSLIPGTYRSFGNDGFKYDVAINQGNNFYIPGDVAFSNFIADALHDASDHIPVVADYQLPARMTATISPADFGMVIAGAQIEIEWSVTNSVNASHVVTPMGADVLQFEVSGSGLIVGGDFGEATALEGPVIGILALDTTGAPSGPASGSVTFASANDAVQPPQIVRHTSGQIIAPSQPSFSSSSLDTTLIVELDLEPDTGEHLIEVPVFNFGYLAESQALMNVDEVSGEAPPLAIISESADDIGSVPAVLVFTFNTDAAPLGIHNFSLTIHTSDENLPGAGSSELDLTLKIGVGDTAACPADLTSSGAVGVPDLLALLAAWGPCEATCTADFTGDLHVGVPDLLVLLASWGPCPR